MLINKNTFVSVAVPTLGREKILLETIGMVLAQDYKNFEVIVANQTKDSTPGFLKSVERLIRNSSRLRYFRIAPPSLPAARNFIISKARGEIIIFIDDDVVLKKDFISNHIQEHMAHPEATIIAGRIVQKGLPLSDFPLYFDKYGLPQGTFNCPKSMPCTMLPGGNHSAKIEALRAIGGYRTAYKKAAIREESDAAYRLGRAGYKMYYSAEAALTHLASSRGGSRIHKAQFDDFRFYVNDLLFALRTVRLNNLPVSLFKRLRIYSGGSGLLSLRRLKRVGLFAAGLMAALWCYLFERRNFVTHEIEGSN